MLDALSKSVGDLYRFCSPEGLALSFAHNAIKPLAGSQPMEIRKDLLHYKNDRGESVFYGVSTTRNPIWKPEGGQPWGPIRLTLDGAALSQKYKIASYNDFWKAEDYAKKKMSTDEFYSQAEEKVITDRHGIKDFKKYIKQVDVLEEERESFIKEGLDKKLSGVPVNFVTKFSHPNLERIMKKTDAKVELAKAGLDIKDDKIKLSDLDKAVDILAAASDDDEFDLSDDYSMENHKLGKFELVGDGNSGNWWYYAVKKDGKDSGYISINQKTHKVGKVPGSKFPSFSDETWLELFKAMDKEFGGDHNF